MGGEKNRIWEVYQVKREVKKVARWGGVGGVWGVCGGCVGVCVVWCVWGGVWGGVWGVCGGVLWGVQGCVGGCVGGCWGGVGGVNSMCCGVYTVYPPQKWGGTRAIIVKLGPNFAGKLYNVGEPYARRPIFSKSRRTLKKIKLRQASCCPGFSLHRSLRFLLLSPESLSLIVSGRLKEIATRNLHDRNTVMLSNAYACSRMA